MHFYFSQIRKGFNGRNCIQKLMINKYDRFLADENLIRFDDFNLNKTMKRFNEF